MRSEDPYLKRSTRRENRMVLAGNLAKGRCELRETREEPLLIGICIFIANRRNH